MTKPIDLQIECRKLSRFIQKADEYKEEAKKRVGLMRAGVSDISKLIGNGREARELLSIMSELAVSAERHISAVQDMQEAFERVMRKQLGCR